MPEPQMFRLNYFCRKLLDFKNYIITDYYAFELFLTKLDQLIQAKNLNQQEDWNLTQQRKVTVDFEEPQGPLGEDYRTES